MAGRRFTKQIRQSGKAKARPGCGGRAGPRPTTCMSRLLATGASLWRAAVTRRPDPPCRRTRRRCASWHELSNGRFDAMRTTIDAAGRLVIPKRIRDRLGLRGNEQVEVTERDGRIEIEPAPTDVELVREGSVLVARPQQPLPALTDAIVRETLDRVRR